MSDAARTALAIFGLGLHAVVAIFPFAATGLVAPLWGFVAVYVWWVFLRAVAIRLFRDGRRRAAVPAVPVIAVVGWLAFVSFGGAVLGWTA